MQATGGIPALFLWFLCALPIYTQLISVTNDPLEDQLKLTMIKLIPDFGMLSAKKRIKATLNYVCICVLYK